MNTSVSGVKTPKYCTTCSYAALGAKRSEMVRWITQGARMQEYRNPSSYGAWTA